MKIGREEESRIQTVGIMFLVAVAATYLVYWLRPVLMPLVVAVFVVSGVSPILSTLERRWGVTRIVAAGLTFLAGVVVLVFFGLSIWWSIVGLAENKDRYLKRIGDLATKVEQTLPLDLFPGESAAAPLPSQASEKTDVQVGGPIDNQGQEQTTTTLEESTPATTTETIQARFENARQLVETSARQGITTVSQALYNLVTTSVVVLIYVFFLLIGTPTIGKSSETVQEIDRQVRSYLSVKTVISLVTGALFGLALFLFGVPMAFTFGVLAFLLNFIPNVGPIVACLLPIPLIVLDPDRGIVWMTAAITVISTIQVVSGNFVEPKIMGNSSNLHPVTILVGLMFWGMMWGIIGMFLATPIMAAVRIMLHKFEPTKPIADLMAGRWE